MGSDRILIPRVDSATLRVDWILRKFGAAVKYSTCAPKTQMKGGSRPKVWPKIGVHTVQQHKFPHRDLAMLFRKESTPSASIGNASMISWSDAHIGSTALPICTGFGAGVPTYIGSADKDAMLKIIRGDLMIF